MPKRDPTQCATEGCRREPRCAVRTTRPGRGDMRVTLHADDRTAPASATRYCQRCARSLLADLVTALVAADDPDQA